MTTLISAFVLAAALSAQAAEVTPKAALERLLELEQVIPQGGVPGQLAWETTFREKTAAAAAPMLPLLAAHGITLESPPSGWLARTDRDFAWNGQAVWLSTFSALSDSQRCERVTLAYLYAVWRVTGLTAEQPVLELNDLLIRDYTDQAALWRDRARAAWTFRFVHAIPAVNVPPACALYIKEAAARREYLFNDDKRPTGLARYMCGRPMNSHWADDDIDAGLRPEPYGWFHKVD